MRFTHVQNSASARQVKRSTTIVFCTLLSVFAPLAASADIPALEQPTLAAPLVCAPHDPVSLVDRARSGTTPCTVGQHQLLLESGYYQNASALGGTALAAYPLLHLRYGINQRVELFFDPATAIAKSGVNGAGIYTWSRSGGGARYQFSNTANHALGTSFTYTPQADETASLSTRERYDFSAQYRMRVSDHTSLGASLGDTLFSQTNISGNGQSSLYARLALTQALSQRMSASALFGRDAHIVASSTPQSKIGLALQDRLSHKAVADVEIGTAINGTGDTKAHYLGFGISFLR